MKEKSEKLILKAGNKAEKGPSKTGNGVLCIMELSYGVYYLMEFYVLCKA